MVRYSLRRLLSGRTLVAILILAIGVIAFVYSFPRFSDAFHVAVSQTKKKDLSPDLPPSFRLMLERQIDEAYMHFYRWSVFFSVSLLVLLAGLYALWSSYRQSREQGEARRRGGRLRTGQRGI